MRQESNRSLTMLASLRSSHKLILTLSFFVRSSSSFLLQLLPCRIPSATTCHCLAKLLVQTPAICFSQKSKNELFQISQRFRVRSSSPFSSFEKKYYPFVMLFYRNTRCLLPLAPRNLLGTLALVTTEN